VSTARANGRPRVSAVIPTYNSGELIDRCLDALDRADAVDEVIVLDGGSTDGTEERAAARSGVRAVRREGTHIGQRLNEGVRMARNDFVLFLNDDAFVDPETPARLVEVMRDRPRTAAAGARLRFGDGREQRSGGRYRTLGDSTLTALSLQRLVKRFRPTVREDPETGLLRATWIPFCAGLVRKAAFEEVGGFDERFSFYSEDQDFARRLSTAGWEIVVRPDAGAVHLGGGATRAKAPGPWFVRYHHNRLVYMQKHYPRGWRLYALVWALRATLHMAVWKARGLRRRLASDAEGARAAADWAATFRQARRLPPTAR
jgi:N-acetylglucosaminyl-diphospho-decaprenol L-rhamnosyltransferase